MLELGIKFSIFIVFLVGILIFLRVQKKRLNLNDSENQNLKLLSHLTCSASVHIYEVKYNEEKVLFAVNNSQIVTLRISKS